MKRDALITIGIVTYNRIEMLRDAVNSVLNQSFQDYCLIIGNDYPDKPVTLNSLGICDAKGRVKIINHTKNIGERNNMNNLLALSSTEWFIWLADDDLLHVDFLSIAFKIIKKNDDAISVFSNYVSSPIVPKGFDNNVPKYEVLKYNSNTFVEEYIQRKILLIGCYGIMKTRVIKEIGGIPLFGRTFGPYSDTILPVLLSKHGSIVYIDAPLQLLRTHEGSMSAASIDFNEYMEAESDFLCLLTKLLPKDKVGELVFYMSCWFADDEKSVIFRNVNNSIFEKLYLFVGHQVKVGYGRVGLVYWAPYTRYLFLTLAKSLIRKVVNRG